jgi:DNA-binding NtrC family response regulator
MNSKKILILEEDLHLRWILKTFLENKGFSIIVSDTIEKALEIISRVKISIFITEFWVDHSNTLEIIKKLKETSPQIYVLLNTNQIIDEKEYQQIIDAGVDDLFEKPFSFDEMMIHLKKGSKKRPIIRVKNRLEKGLPKSKPRIGAGL